MITTQIWEEIYYSLISRRLFPEKQKDAIRKQEEQVIYSTLINTFWRREKRNQKCSYGVDWLQKVIRYNNHLSQNVQDIRQSHKVYQKIIKKLECTMDSRRKNFSYSKNPMRYIPGRCTVIMIAMMPLNHIIRKCTDGHRLLPVQEN